MAGCSILENRSDSSCITTEDGCSSNGCCSDIDHAVKVRIGESDDLVVKQRSLFYLFLSCFLKEFSSRGSVRPMPAMLGDGGLADLFKLFVVVREKGGYDFVSKNGLWGLVVKELGLDLKVSASLKLVYFKYLNEVEKWFRGGFRDRVSQNAARESDGTLGFLSLELEKKFRGLLANGMYQGVTDNGVTLLKHEKNGKWISKDTRENELNPFINCRQSMCNGSFQMFSDDDKKVCKNNHVIPNPATAKNEGGFRKRKRLYLSGMLNWVIQIAKSPHDPSVGGIPEPSKWKEHQGSEFWIQVIRAREALVQKKQSHSITEQSLLQDKQKMHPSMYDEEFLGHHSSERLRIGNRIPTPTRNCPCSCCNPRPASQKVASPKRDPHVILPSSNWTADPFEDDFIEKHVSVGPSFQAEVPEWTGMVSDSETKWLGTCVWPLESGEHDPLAGMDSIGRGRPQSCGCLVPGSVECFRFHIAEKRMKLKLELGSVFYHWRFDRMGEEVSLCWTIEEERRFKHMVRTASQSLDACFWADASKYFCGKTREDLVSYYFNVLSIQRRSYQNRVTSRNIDSDNDEEEFGCISDSFGLDALNVPGTNKLMCSQNNQCTDLA
ncbi:hypothetical protein SLEP1_g8622 [Rubroshorea leprosula]|uniref:ARID domain-containing protein n=1 Tax=Rubroshorea leprosula TaxID=152421 RepID=A0AAV5IA77_9ROSI|nr:hypothetical protein SLEP1_g8622 [Rubroshorea leprosula]